MTTRHKTTGLLTMVLMAGLVAGRPTPAAELTPQESETLAAPLPPGDPRAQVDPSLLGVPDAPIPVAGSARRISARRARRALGHDIATGRTRVDRTPAVAAEDDREPLSHEDAGAAVTDPGAADPEHGGLDPRVIWGADDRVRITPTTSYPWRAQNKLILRFPNGAVYGCSGTLIAPKYIITAGHCVHSQSDGGWATSIEAIPGYDNGYRPYGSAFATYLRSVTGWTVSQNSLYDYALITLDRNIGNTVGWFGYGAFSDTTLNAASANLTGYPGDKCGGACQYYDADPFTNLTSLTTHYLTDTAPGQSGSGVYIFYNGGRYVAAAHRGTCSDSGSANCGPRITSSRFTQIQGWIASGS